MVATIHTPAPSEERMATIKREFEEIMALSFYRQEQELPRFFKSLTLVEHSRLLSDLASRSGEEKARREFKTTLFKLFQLMHGLDKFEDIETLLNGASPEVRGLFPDWSELAIELRRCRQQRGNVLSLFTSFALIELGFTAD